MGKKKQTAGGTSTPKKSAKKSTDELEKSVADKFLAASSNTTTEEEITEEPPESDVLDSTQIEPGEVFEKVVNVDFWLTNLHSAEIGIYQKERFMAKNRAFSRNLELIGAVHEEGKPDGMFGINKDNWYDVPVKELAQKRIVIKWFNMDSVAHIGTIEEIVLTSLHASIASNDELPAFKIVIPNFNFLIDLKKEHTRFPKIGEMFSCSFKDKDGNWHPIIFDEKRITIGSDWDVKIGDGTRIVAKIDEKVLNVGGKIIVTFLDKDLYKTAPFFKTVILFAMMCNFKKEIIADIANLRGLVDAGKVMVNLSPEEEKFFLNPRMLRHKI